MNLGISRRTWLVGALAPAALIRAENREGDVNDEIRELSAHASLSMQFKGTTAAECRQWQERFAAKLRELLGALQEPRKTGAPRRFSPRSSSLHGGAETAPLCAFEVSVGEFKLLYVGISCSAKPAAARQGSRQSLYNRIRYHMNGNAEGSTLRLSLGCVPAESCDSSCA